MSSLRDHIMRARQAQVDNEQLHDVQLAMISFDSSWDDEIGDWADPDLGRLTDEREEVRESDVPEPPVTEWATENEKRDHFHREIDEKWEDWIREHYDYTG